MESPNPRIIVFSNQKGGVGKTTLARLVGIELCLQGKSVLLIDADPQANLTKSFQDDTNALPGLFDALQGGTFDLLKIPFADRELALLSGDIKLATLERSLIGELDAYIRLRELLQRQEFSAFEYILLDSPPSLGVLSINCLAAANSVIVPVCAALYSMQGTNDLMATIAKVRKNINHDLSLLGIIINAYDSHPVITRQIKSEIESTFGDKLFSTALSRTVKVEESLAARRELAADSKVAEEIRQIVDELLSRLEAL